MKSTSRKIFLPGLFFIVIALLVFATKGRQVTKKEGTFTDSCGISFPEPRGYTNDFVALFNERELIQLDSMIAQHEKETGNQIAIITVDSTMMGICNLEEYSVRIANHWGVGQEDKDNGIMIGIAPSLRKVTIRNGYGIESKMTDKETKIIIDSIMIPFFKEGQYFEGTRSGLFAIFTKIR